MLHIVADITGLRQGGGIGNHKGNADDFSQGRGEQGLARAGRADEQDIGFA